MNTKDREEYYHAAGRAGISLRAARTIWGAAMRYHRACENECNGHPAASYRALTDAEHDAWQRRQDKAQALAVATVADNLPRGLKAEWQNDPRGAALKVTKRGNAILFAGWG
jgi:hypothetical protein